MFNNINTAQFSIVVCGRNNKKNVSIGINCYQSANLEWSSPIRSE